MPEYSHCMISKNTLEVQHYCLGVSGMHGIHNMGELSVYAIVQHGEGLECTDYGTDSA